MALFGSSSKKVLFMRVNQVFIDLVIFCVAFFVSFFIRWEGAPPGPAFQQMMLLFPYVVIARIIFFAVFSVYSIIWRFISVADVLPIIRALLPVSIVLTLGRLVLPDSLVLMRMPLSVISMEFLFSLTGVMGVRVLRRLQYEEGRRHQLKEGFGDEGRRVKAVLIGAGSAGNLVAKELKQRADLGLDIVGFVDDDGQKTGKHIQGLKVLGTTPQLPRLAKEHCIEEAVITIVNASSKQIRRISGLCAEAGLKTRIVPGLFELLDKRITITKVREINIDDLLGRTVFNLDQYYNEVSSAYRGKRILVTGAGGSIGSELCRQLAVMGPSEIVLLDKDENSVFEIDGDLKGRQINGTAVHAVIANITNQVRLKAVFARFRPQIVFHAAAHKHVPLMESNVTEAILNNVGGTKNVVDVAGASGVEQVIFISTDKAVNPTNIMGATKKIGEAYVQAKAKGNGTRFACVRFGNVIGSRGSVVPIFQRQIALGGPVTVTHPEVRRYFMSIPEAVHLIIQAGTLGEKGEIFVLDMGRPIKILDLVKSLIRLSGHKEEDIEIKFVGMRPGEKMFEEILIDEEKTRATKFEKIFIAPPLEVLNGKTVAGVDSLLEAAAAGDGGTVIRQLFDLGIGFSSEVHR